MTKEEFIKYYCAGSVINKAAFDRDLIALPCSCGDSGCHGWVAVSNNPRAIKSHQDLYQGGIMSEWQPIETAPKTGEKILICGGTYGCEFSPCEFYGAPNHDVLIVMWCNNRKHFAESDFHYTPTHWMPLPKPPGVA